ncbi:MAG TPA: F-box protein [Flavobacterium sp.]|nr:F-box protein [Flavobacterium sp.]
MKINLKFPISSEIIAVTFALFPVINGMEDFSKSNEDVQRPYRVSSSIDITEESQPKKRDREEIRENLFERCPLEIVFNILERAAIANYFSGNTVSLRLVCKNWRDIVEQNAMKESIKSAIYQRFLKGVLIYRPQVGSDVGRIDLRISALENPLEGTFDLSQCGDTGKYLSISTGYHKEKKPENAGKVEIWFVPKFLIERELNTTAKHFQSIFPTKWHTNAPVGVFWTWGGWDDLSHMDYLVTQNMEALSNGNLYEKWVAWNTEHFPGWSRGGLYYEVPCKKFDINFIN